MTGSRESCHEPASMIQTACDDASQERVPNFCIGAQRAATTYLYELLAAYTNAQLSPLKEVHFFDAPTVGTLHAYHSCFPGLINAVDITPGYSVNKERLNRIFKYNARARLLLIERNPVDRIVSHYLYYRDRYSDAGSFDSFLSNNRDDCIGRCAYQAIASAIASLFGAEHFMRLSYEDLTRHPETSIDAVINFFGLRRVAVPLVQSSQRVVNSSGRVRSSHLFRTLRSAYRRLPITVPYSLKARLVLGLDLAYTRLAWLRAAPDPQDAEQLKCYAAQYLTAVRPEDFWI